MSEVTMARCFVLVLSVCVLGCSEASEPIEGLDAGEADQWTGAPVYAGFEGAGLCASELPRLLEIGEPCGAAYGDCLGNEQCASSLRCVGGCIEHRTDTEAFGSCVLGCYPDDDVMRGVQAVYWCACCDYQQPACDLYCAAAQSPSGPTMCN